MYLELRVCLTVPRVEINVEIYGWFTFASTVKTRPQAWFVDGCVVYKDKYGLLGFSIATFKDNYGHGKRKHGIYNGLW